MSPKYTVETVWSHISSYYFLKKDASRLKLNTVLISDYLK